jgi:hypothetical protein
LRLLHAAPTLELAQVLLLLLLLLLLGFSGAAVACLVPGACAEGTSRSGSSPAVSTQDRSGLLKTCYNKTITNLYQQQTVMSPVYINSLQLSKAAPWVQATGHLHALTSISS